jgi:hypothetical protein
MAPSLHCLYRHRYIAVPSDEGDWESDVRRSELTLKFKAALSGQSYVEYQAGGTVRAFELEKVGNGRKQLGIQANRSQQTPNRIANVLIVVDDQDRGAGL